MFAQDSAFGQANDAAVKAVIGGAGATVTARAARRARPPSSRRSPAGQGRQAGPALRGLGRHDRPGDVAGARPAGRARPSTTRRHRPGPARVVADLRRGRRPKISFLAHYFDGASETKANDRAGRGAQEAGQGPRPVPPGRLHRRADDGPRGRGAAATTSTRWSPRWRAGRFDAVKGKQTVRAADHALLQPMFQVKLTGTGAAMRAAASCATSPGGRRDAAGAAACQPMIELAAGAQPPAG